MSPAQQTLSPSTPTAAGSQLLSEHRWRQVAVSKCLLLPPVSDGSNTTNTVLVSCVRSVAGVCFCTADSSQLTLSLIINYP